LGVPVKALAFTADGKRLIAGLTNGDISIWDTVEGKKIRVLHAHNFPVHSVAIRDDGGVLISGSRDLKVWHLSDGELLSAYQGHTGPIRGIAITKKGDLAISGSDDTTIRVWDLVKKTCVGVLAGHTRPVLGVAVAEDGKYFASCSSDMPIRIWNLLEGTCLSILEGHTQPILSIVTTRDGRFVISASKDKTIRIWNIEKGDCIAILRGHEDQVFEIRIAADDRTMISSSADGTVRIWDIAVFISEDYALTKGSLEIEQISTQKYTNAKVLLVGDSGVGKTGLAYRLTQNTYVSTDSTDGVWATQLKLPHSLNTNDTEREIWLWDFAGQADYRLIHQLFMDETSLAVLVFNPQADNPFEGLGQWDKDLRRAARRPFNKLLVAGRCDRGSLMVSAKTIDSFKDEREFSQYLETSGRRNPMDECKRLSENARQGCSANRV
jgi:small GTP-binding protein